MPFGETEMQRIERVYGPMFREGFLSPELNPFFDYRKTLRLAREYEGMVPIYVPVLQRYTTSKGNRFWRTVYYLVDYDFNFDEVATVYKMRAPRRGASREPRLEDLDDYVSGKREYLTWSDIPAIVVEDIKSHIYHMRKEELKLWKNSDYS